MKKKTKKNRKIKPFTIIMIIIDVFVGGCFFLFYGPFKGFKNKIISTAMITKTHQWVAYTFYSEEEVSKVVASNSYIIHAFSILSNIFRSFFMSCICRPVVGSSNMNKLLPVAFFCNSFANFTLAASPPDSVGAG